MQPVNRTSPNLPRPLIAGVAGMVCLAAYSPVSAQSAPTGALPDPAARQAAGLQPAGALALDFDVTATDRSAGLRPVEAEDAPGLTAGQAAESEWLDEGIRREWSYRPLADGPELTVAGLGGGRKKAGKLAQLLVNWEF